MTTQQILQGVHDWTNGKIVYDISVAHPDGQGKPTPYADLTAALGTGGANIPEPLRKGGMSVKFIQGTAQSSDNNYVQFRLMADSFNAIPANWQGVDDKPTVGSNNLVKSNGVAFFDDAVLKPYVRLVYIENKEAALQDGIFFRNLQYNYNLIYFGKADGSYFAVGSLTASADGTFKYVLNNHATYGTIYIEVENGDSSLGDLESSNKNNLKGALCYKPYMSLLSRRVNNDRVFLNNSIIRFSNLEKFSSPAQTRWTSSNLNQYVYCLYIENRAAVIENTLALTHIQFDYNLVYFKPANGSQFSKTLRVLENGHRVSEWDDNTYGHCYIEVYNDDGQSHQADTPSNTRNICERAFNRELYDILKLNDITTETILYGGNETVEFCTDPTLKNHLISIFVENRAKAIEDGLYLRYIQYEYNAVWFYDKNSVTAFRLKFNRTTYIGETNDATYGYIRIEVAHEAGETNYQSNPNLYNLTERCYNPYFNDGLIKEIQDIKNAINNKPLSGKKILAIGDSVTAGHQWGNKVAEVTGAEVSFHAKGGIRIISMVDGSSPDLAPLSTEDVTDKDYIIALGFYNDRFNGDGGNATDMYPTDTTFTGKLNYLIAKIQEKLIAADNRKCKIVIVSAHRYGKYPYINKTAYEDGEQLCAATKLCADWNSVYFIDLMHRGNINKFNWDWFQSSSTPYNQNYIPADGDNDGTNKPFNSLEDAPNASENNGKYITVLNQSGCYQSNGSDWIRNTSIPFIWNGDQLHPNLAGYNRIGEFIARQIVNI